MSKQCKDVTISKEQENFARQWLKKLKGGELKQEKSNHIHFQKKILEGILQYDEDDIHYENRGEDFRINNESGDVILTVEAKGSDTDLYKYQQRDSKDKEKPILQTWSYMGRDKREYGICTNYNKFILITKTTGYEKQHVFDFDSMEGDSFMDKLKEFVYVFSKHKLVDGASFKVLRAESEKEGKDLTEEFYAIYGQTRLMLIKEFELNGMGKEGAINCAQMFLNRIMFVFFAEDIGLVRDQELFTNGVIDVLKGKLGSNTSRVWKYIIDELFVGFDVGSEEPAIFGFNGGLFREPLPVTVKVMDKRDKDFFKDFKLKTSGKSYKFKEHVRIAIEKNEGVSPIIKNLLAMSSYDFKSQIRVNILGHIFENSISDLEILLGKKDSKRKKEGVYYTPEYITDYICRNTIIPYLSKSGNVNTPHELVREYENELDSLDNKLRNIKVLDPACGSGAFLIEAAKTLLRIYDEIQEYKTSMGLTDGGTLETVLDEARIREIIRNNIYGIDINSQSVEITKLSLFLMTASEYEKLPNLSKNIVAGNSVSNDEFSWDTAFPEIFSKNNYGFDVIIGNPPYVRQEDLKDKKHLMQLSELNRLDIEGGFTIPSKSDLSSYFYYHSLNYLKDDGKLGFIISDGWMHMDYGIPVRELFLNNCTIETLLRTRFNVFEDADVKTIVTVLTRGKLEDSHMVKMTQVVDRDRFMDNTTHKVSQRDQKDFSTGNWNLYFLDVVIEPTIKMIKMEDVGLVKAGRKTGCNNFFVLKKEEVDKWNIPCEYIVPVVSRNIKGVDLDGVEPTEFLLNVQNSKGNLLKTTDGQKVLEYITKRGDEEVIPKKGNDKTKRKICELSTVKTNSPYWYSLGIGIPDIILARFAHGRMKMYENNGQFCARDNYVLVTLKPKNLIKPLLTYLSSSYCTMLQEIHGHPQSGKNGGSLQLLAGDCQKIKVPDFDEIEKHHDELTEAWETYKNELKIDPLDDIVLKVLFQTEDDKEILEIRTRIRKEIKSLIRKRERLHAYIADMNELGVEIKDTDESVLDNKILESAL